MSNPAEQAKSQQLPSSEWTMSLEAQNNGTYDTLLQYARVARIGHIEPFLRYPRYVDPEDELEVQEWSEAGEDLYAASKLFAQSDENDRIAMAEVWHGDIDWIYNHPEVPAQRFAADKMSRYVLSGLLGEELLHTNDQLRDYARQFELSPLDRAILVGGAALAAESRRDLFRNGSAYVGITIGGEVAETWVGGDIHRDFRTTRYMRPLRGVTTSLQPERSHSFMPISHIEYAAAGQNDELPIIEKLLVHALEQGATPDELYASIMAKLEGMEIQEASFADWGRMYYYPGSIRRHRKEFSEKGSVERHSPAVQISQLLLDSEKDGVRFRSGGSSNIKIPTTEIADYVATMIRGEGGRTSVASMVQLVEALVKEDSDIVEGV